MTTRTQASCCAAFWFDERKRKWRSPLKQNLPFPGNLQGFNGDTDNAPNPPQSA
ncbi:MAG: hypothetical protein KME06_20950 [Kastovskya adunca ATA6-11-RM4]|nr:hypothetical protein [Kastovskya adunca ATA6-11-RM4]